MAGAVPVQTQEDLVPPPPIAVGYRLSGVLLAPAVAVAVHVVLIGPVGLDLQVTQGPGSSSLVPLSLLATVLVALVVGLLGWLAVALLERGLGGPRGRRIWTILALVVFMVSLVPVIVLDVPQSARWGLFTLHATVALVLLPTLSSGRTAHAPFPGGRGPESAMAQEDTHADAQTGVHAVAHHSDGAHT
ncbi:MAG TPA: DUF6069 family protein [Euzebya sp.]|nr:DUF6069 family protein [Euzebya sp.]